MMSEHASHTYLMGPRLPRTRRCVCSGTGALLQEKFEDEDGVGSAQ